MLRVDGKADVRVHFESLTDPRRGKITYPLINVVVMTLCAVVCGAEDFVSVAYWARHHKDWLAAFLDMSAGVPSHDRFNAILAALKPAEFERCLLSWITALHEITSGQAVACIAVKDNQPKLHEAVRSHFDALIESGLDEAQARLTATRGKDHGRDEHRCYVICPVPRSVKDLGRWTRVKALGMATSVTIRDGKEHTDVRHYILTQCLSAKRFAEAVRSHWGIENSLHWQLDVSFNEDQCRIRKGHADANFSIIRRFALGLLKNEKTVAAGIKNKRHVLNRPGAPAPRVFCGVSENPKQMRSQVWSRPHRRRCDAACRRRGNRTTQNAIIGRTVSFRPRQMS